MRKAVVSAVLGVLALGAGFGSFTVAGSAHVPQVSATCDLLTVNLTKYNDSGTNTVKVVIDEAVVEETEFDREFKKSYPVEGEGYDYKVYVTAHDDPDGTKGWTKTYKDHVAACPAPTDTPTTVTSASTTATTQTQPSETTTATTATSASSTPVTAGTTTTRPTTTTTSSVAAVVTTKAPTTVAAVSLPRTGADGTSAILGISAVLLLGGSAAVWLTRGRKAAPAHRV